MSGIARQRGAGCCGSGSVDHHDRRSPAAPTLHASPRQPSEAVLEKPADVNPNVLRLALSHLCPTSPGRHARVALAQYLVLKRLLERAHASSAAQLHALQTELHMLRSAPPPPPTWNAPARRGTSPGTTPCPTTTPPQRRKVPPAPPSSATALPGDVPLQKYAVRSHDLVGCLAPPLALRILRLLPVPRPGALALPLSAPNAYPSLRVVMLLNKCLTVTS
ncbi:hypothetical protein B0H17DRAFT_1336404 [Mycena rosella]|uniref:Uncharacterized protein n=1 Tax=Mycena rosella TaxID=1033263 RepID=A0AAD7CZF4_MYCRO|nr:hypothetical protein B0H17DRAFT_1336404 [Mycena rosella]